MSQLKADSPRTVEEFRIWHERQPEVHELINGVPRPWEPGSKARTLIRGNVARALDHAAAGAGYRVLVASARIEAGNSSVIPDIVLAHDLPDLDTARVDEPVVIVEILAPIGGKDDLGRKLALYLGIPSLRHYLVVHQDERQIVHSTRRDDFGGRFLTRIAPPDPIRLDPPGIALAFDAVYAGLPPDLLGPSGAAPPLTAP